MRITQDEGQFSAVQDHPTPCRTASIHRPCSLKPIVFLIVARTPKATTTNFQIAPLGGTVENHRIK